MAKQKDLADKVFGTRDFFRTLSYREFVTVFALALLLNAAMFLFQYFLYLEWFGHYGRWLLLVIGLVIILMNHVVYRFEHRRSNNYIGRNIADYLLCLATYMIAECINLVLNGRLKTEIGAAGELIVGVILFIGWIMVFELCVAGLKRVLIKIKCRLI